MANRWYTPNEQFEDAVGLPYAGGKLYFYLSETSTPANTYNDPDLDPTHANTNPVILDPAGRSGNIFLDPSISYKVILTDANDVEIWRADPVVDPAANVIASFQAVSGNPTGQLAGVAGVVGGASASVAWDIANNILYVCTTTGTSSTAVWTPVASSLSGAIVMSSTSTPAGIGSDQNDYNPTGLDSSFTLRLNAASNLSITGLVAGTAGQVLNIENVGTYTIYLRAENTASVAANRFAFATDYALLGSESVFLWYDGVSSRWRVVGAMNLLPATIPSASGVVITQNTGTPTTRIDVTSSYAVLSHNALTVYALRPTGISGTINAAVTGVNGLDTGALANNTWYYVFLITNALYSQNATDGLLLSTSSTAPTLPVGYTYFLRIGAVRTGGSATFMRTIQKGKDVRYSVQASGTTTELPVMDSGQTSASMRAVATGSFVPPTATTITVRAVMYSGSGAVLVLAPNGNYSATPNATTNASLTASINGTATVEMELESANIYMSCTGSAAASNYISCYGWKDSVQVF